MGSIIDYAGNVTAITDPLDTVPYGTLTYDYDQIGNITYNSQVGSYTYGAQPHAAVQAGAHSYRYDLNGNMIERGGKVLTYDYDNRPVSIATATGSVSIVYDYAGQRVKKIRSSGTTIYIGKLYECTSGNCTKYIFAGNTRIASKTATNTYYYHNDHLGSTSVVTDAYGNKAQEVRYYPFGQVRSKSGSVDLKHKFTGQEEDPETGLYFYNARYYDPVLARFISADTIVQDPSDPQDLNRYSYCRNNPINYIDPSGHGFFSRLWKSVKKVVKAVVGVVVGVAVTIVTAGAGAPAVIAGMLGGMVAGGVSSAVNGGNILRGIVMGGITGAITAGAFYGAGEVIKNAAISSSIVKAGIHAVAGAVSGGIGSAIYGGDIGLGMLTGAISAGIAQYAGGSKLFPDSYGYQLAGRTLIGGISGGIVAELYGGSFGEGFAIGGIAAAAGFLFNEGYHRYKVIGYVVGPNGQSVPRVYDTITKQYTIGYPETNQTDSTTARGILKVLATNVVNPSPLSRQKNGLYLVD